ncbi:tRNA uridine(34) 5-carboxymethylaminomethyl modification radical SAM/GNAT enzyme Elp3 [archaeon]|nr:tRNA uridine(34) 5-carboxymethylaminomethyl modification radical SAM/GNAT enzyme Elp3 [archaeon]
MQIQQEAFKEFIENKDKKDFDRIKIQISKKYKLKKIPKNIDLLLKDPKSNIITKPTRTISGVTPVAIMTRPEKCPHGVCTFCPGGPDSILGNVPQSYTGNEPASMRAIRNKLDPYLQVFNRLEHYALLNQNFNKCEVIIMSGTFLSSDKEYINEFLTYTYKAFNDFGNLFFKNKELQFNKFKKFFQLDGDFKDPIRIEKIQKKLLKFKNKTTLKQEQEKNETSNCRVVALCIETKPDWSKEEHINNMLNLGTTRVELGIQTLNDETLKKVNRGHSLKDSIEATQLLKDSFLKVTYHMMPGLPNSNKQKDVKMFKDLFSNENYKPDSLKIYPCLVMPGTPLYQQWKQGKFKPITTADASERISEAKKYIPEYCRIMRIQRDIPTKVTSAGVDKTNLRQYISKLVAKKGIICKCIRCREPRNREIDFNNVKILTKDYKASKGTEIFISMEDVKNNILLGFVRLRIPYKPFRKEITKDSAGIRELHVYGTSTQLEKKGNIQHQGLGKKLMLEAEKIAKEKYNIKKLLVISGIGVKEYYQNNFNYKKDGPYLSKIL